ncbi:Uncharacterised protein [Mycobacteroides abscessus subsp. abscessus]|nr:Uncharacterised protein [Mycobacteroides abscessus subsp. abscessus]
MFSDFVGDAFNAILAFLLHLRIALEHTAVFNDLFFKCDFFLLIYLFLNNRVDHRLQDCHVDFLAHLNDAVFLHPGIESKKLIKIQIMLSGNLAEHIAFLDCIFLFFQCSFI